MTRDELLASINEFRERHDMSKMHFGVNGARDHGFVGKLERGRANPSMKRIEAIQAWMKRVDDGRPG